MSCMSEAIFLRLERENAGEMLFLRDLGELSKMNEN